MSETLRRDVWVQLAVSNSLDDLCSAGAAARARGADVDLFTTSPFQVGELLKCFVRGVDSAVLQSE